jgi:hypothetical protein
MTAQIDIPARFNGPPTSGNGGYSCGIVADYIDGPARVRLHVPPPLDTPMQVTVAEDGSVEMHDGETLVGSGQPIDYKLEMPLAPTLEQAKDATTRFPAYENHIFPTCFVCGPRRPHHDGLEIFPGPVEDWSLLACVWAPSEDLLDEAGNVPSHILWAALDCPGAFAIMGGKEIPAVLGQLDVEIKKTVKGGEPLVVYSWPLGNEGRKYYAGAAIATASGEVVASSSSIWIELKD